MQHSSSQDSLCKQRYPYLTATNWFADFRYLFKNKLNTTNAYCFNDISPHKARKGLIFPTEPQRFLFTSFEYKPLQEVHQYCFLKQVNWKVLLTIVSVRETHSVSLKCRHLKGVRKMCLKNSYMTQFLFFHFYQTNNFCNYSCT